MTPQVEFFFPILLLSLFAPMRVDGACDVNTTIISVRENAPPGTVILRLPRQPGEQWSFHEDGPPGYILLQARRRSIVFLLAASPDLEQLGSKANSRHESLPFTLECSFDGWKHVFKQSVVLLDDNDNDPMFQSDRPGSISVSENTAPGTAILQLQDYAVDPDVSGYVTAYDVVRHDDAEVDGHDYFSVSETGQTLVVRQQLDFDQLRHRGPTFYLLNLTATDNGYPLQRTAYTTLQINISDSDDQGPAFVYPDCPLLDGYCATPLYETVARKSFTGEVKVWPGSVKAVDRDSLNTSILYFIVNVSPEEYSGHFQMDIASGRIDVVQQFSKDDMDAIHVTVKAQENSMARRFVTATLRVQVVGEYYAHYRESFRKVPFNEVVSPSPSPSSSSGLPISSVPVSLFIATVVIFFILVVTFPFVIIRVIKGKLTPATARVTSLQLNNGDSPLGSRKESTDSTSQSQYTTIYTCTPTPSTSTHVGYGPGVDDTVSECSSTSASPPMSSVRLNFEDAISFASPDPDADHRLSSVTFDPEEVSTSFRPQVPMRRETTAAERFKRRLSKLLSFEQRRGKRGQKHRVRFDIRDLSDFS